LKQREIFQLFDRVFKCLMGLSDRAVIRFINGLFGTSHPPDSAVDRPGTETVDRRLRRTQADMLIVINGRSSYLVEAQIKNDGGMAFRIFQYMMDIGWRNPSKEGGLTRVRLPDARVIYLETTAGTPDRETIVLELPSGAEYPFTVPSFKLPEYTAAMLEERDLGILLPFCVLRLRRELKAAESGAERRALAGRMKGLLEEIIGAAERSGARGAMSGGDLANVLHLTRLLHDELYLPYTEFAEDEEMWEDVKLIDYDGIMRERDEAVRERDEAVRKLKEMGVSRGKTMWEDVKLIDYDGIMRERDEAVRERDEAVRKKNEAFREREEAFRKLKEREIAVRKLREAGVSEEQLAAGGLV
jgi:hypothetical protein